jgi:hypothetical protein
MNLSKGLLLGVISGAVASGVSILYNQVYCDAFQIDFKTILNPVGIGIACMIGCILMGLTYVLISKLNKPMLVPVANILFCILSFASIISVLSFKMPLEIDFPEMFPGLAIPMHFFPALSFLALVPFFWKFKTSN